MKADIPVNTRLSPRRRPGQDILLRAMGRSPTQIAQRDLARYYDLLEASLQGLRGRFSVKELEALARAPIEEAYQLSELDLAARYALADAIERYLAGQQGEEKWKEVGLI